MRSQLAAAAARDSALRAGVRLEVATVAWMAVEAVLAIAAGIMARSVLLTAFGADSLIELLSGATLLWRLRTEQVGDGDVSRIDQVERRAAWISAGLLILLCAYVVISSAAGLLFRIQPQRSWLGLGVSAIAVVAMPWLARRKRKINETIQSPALRADIAESITCAYLAGVTLLGLAFDIATGWWIVEYVAALALLVWLVPEVREAIEAARGSTHVEDD